MSHGLGALKKEMYFERELFLDFGYDLLLYDQRNSGENFAPLNTFGYYEAYDLKDIFLYADKVNNRKKILWGQSMGAMAIAISIGKFDIKPEFLIFDSPVFNGKEMIYKEFDNIEKETGIHKYLMVMSGNLISKIRYGFDFSDLTANKYLRDTDIPLLMLSAKNDEITSLESQRDFFNRLNNINKKNDNL